MLSRRILIACFAVLATMALTAGTASGRRIAVDDQDMVVIFDDASQRLTFDAGGNAVQCEVTLSGSYHSSTIAKVTGSLVGHATNVNVDTAGCTGGNVQVLSGTLPWHYTYQGFRGVLPRIEGGMFHVINVAYLIDIEGIECLGRSDVTDPVIGETTVSTTTGQVTSLTAQGVVDVGDLSEFAFQCDFIGSGQFSGTGRVRDAEGNLVFIRLV
jgi:hypothetical protein